MRVGIDYGGLRFTIGSGCCYARILLRAVIPFGLGIAVVARSADSCQHRFASICGGHHAAVAGLTLALVILLHACGDGAINFIGVLNSACFCIKIQSIGVDLPVALLARIIKGFLLALAENSGSIKDRRIVSVDRK